MSATVIKHRTVFQCPDLQKFKVLTLLHLFLDRVCQAVKSLQRSFFVAAKCSHHSMHCNNFSRDGLYLQLK